MQKRVRILFLTKFFVVALLLAALVSGCSTDPYTAAMAGSKDVSDAISAILPILQEVQQDKLISTSQLNEVLGYLDKTTRANQAFRAAVKQVHSSGQAGAQGYLDAADVFIRAVQTQQIVGLPAKLQPYITAVDTAIHGIELAVAKAKGGK
jgi:hypothetical protein